MIFLKKFHFPKYSLFCFFTYTMPPFKKKQRYTISLDEFFKYECKELFTALGCVVQTDFELLKQPKRLDLLIIKKAKIKEQLLIFNYFSEHNLISYKSFRDSFREADIRSLEVYHRSYLNLEKKAHAKNTTMTLIVSQKPAKFLKENRQFVSELSTGRYLIDYNLYQTHILNLEELSLEGIDGALLSEFVKDKSRIGDPKELKKLSDSQNILDILSEGLNFRYRHFEGGRAMGAVADVTDIVLPKIEEAEKKGIEKGRKEGIEKGKVEKGIETASVMDKKGYPLNDIVEITGLTKEQLKNAGINGASPKQ